MARRSRRDKHGGEGHGDGSHERWLVSYADFITLMFVVFTVLFAMARVDIAKYEVLADSLSRSFGPGGLGAEKGTGRGGGGVGQPISPASPPDLHAYVVGPPLEDELAQIDQALSSPVRPPAPPKPPPIPDPTPAPVTPPDPMDALADAFLGLAGARTGLLKVMLQERGLFLSIEGSVLFEPGSALLKSSAHPHLNEIAARLSNVELPIMVQGTADEVPVPSSSLDSWDLAALRAGAVVRYLVEGQGLKASNFVTIGYIGENAVRQNHVTIIVLRRAADLP